ncbi:MAG: hypothetical protein ACRDZV_05360, partial [Acidimicrobiia bacterium]
LPRPAKSGHARAAWAGVRAVATDRWVRRLAFINALENVIDYAFLGFLTLFLVAERGFSSAGAAAMVAIALGGAMLGYAVLAAAKRTLHTRSTFVAVSAVRVTAIVVLLMIPDPIVITVTAFGLGVAGAVFWVKLQASMLQARPGETGTTYAVIATLSLPALAVPPLIGAAADRFGLVAGLALYALMPVLVLGLAAVPSLWQCSDSSSPR